MVLRESPCKPEIADTLYFVRKINTLPIKFLKFAHIKLVKLEHFKQLAGQFCSQLPGKEYQDFRWPPVGHLERDVRKYLVFL